MIKRDEHSFSVPLRTNSNANAREHYAVRAKRVERERRTTTEAWIAAGSVAPTWPTVVTLTRISPRLLDSGDNLPSAMKAPRDALAKAWGIDDRDPRVEWRYAQRKGPPKTYAVVVEWTTHIAWASAEIERLQREIGGAA